MNMMGIGKSFHQVMSSNIGTLGLTTLMFFGVFSGYFTPGFFFWITVATGVSLTLYRMYIVLQQHRMQMRALLMGQQQVWGPRGSFNALNLRLTFVDRDFTEADYETLLALDKCIPNNKGASKCQVDVLPAYVSAISPSDENSCSICLECVAVGDNIRVLPCGHEFHMDCVDKWLYSNATCPICKTSIKEQNK